MSQANQALWFNAVPLLVVGAAYLGATALLWPPLWAERRRASPLDVSLFLVFPAIGLAAAASGFVLVADPDPFPGGVWLTLVATIVTAVPAVLALIRWRERAVIATGGMRVREAEALGSLGGRELESMAAVTSALGRTDDPGVLAASLLEQIEALIGAELACLMLVDDDSRTASGLIGRVQGRALDWFPEARIDLVNEPSGVATAVFESTPFAVYDAHASKIVSPRLVEATGAKSVAFVPLIADEHVIAVLVVGTVNQPRAFADKELALLQTLAGEAALALGRARSTVALADALERERFVARLSARVRSELDIDELLRVAVKQTGVALGVDRCLIRLGGVEGDVTAQWHSSELAPVQPGTTLSVSNLAVERRETIAIEDVEASAELNDPSLGGRDTLRELGSRAVLAVPIVVFDELIGVLALHRRNPGPWPR